MNKDELIQALDAVIENNKMEKKENHKMNSLNAALGAIVIALLTSAITYFAAKNNHDVEFKAKTVERLKNIEETQDAQNQLLNNLENQMQVNLSDRFRSTDFQREMKRRDEDHHKLVELFLKFDESSSRRFDELEDRLQELEFKFK